jgi:hypothetical protein
MLGGIGASDGAPAAGAVAGAAQDGAAHAGAAGVHFPAPHPPHAWAAPVPTNVIEALNKAELTNFNMIILLDLS